MAMVSTHQKPKQRERQVKDLKGEFSEGLPGSTKSEACIKRNVENLGDPEVPVERQVGNRKEE
jgi:hypothetical protein